MLSGSTKIVVSGSFSRSVPASGIATGVFIVVVRFGIGPRNGGSLTVSATVVTLKRCAVEAPPLPVAVTVIVAVTPTALPGLAMRRTPFCVSVKTLAEMICAGEIGTELLAGVVISL